MILRTRLPYPGLRAFTRDESDLFFGREGCVDAMVDRFAATRFLAVLGPSGSGKSSLVRTGFQDALNLGLHPTAGTRWKVADFHPGGQPMRNLARGLLATRGMADPEEIDVQLLTEYLSRGPRAVLEWAAGGNLEPGINLLLMADQFEELFRYGDYAEREAAEAFVALLLETAAAPGVAIHVVITMRSEYLGACALIAGLAERVNDGLYLTPRMGREECREAIEGPASVIGFKVERALVNRLLNDLGSFAPWETGEVTEQAERLSRQADQLPVMQHVLNRLYVRALEHSPESSQLELKLSDYDQIGGLSGALDAHGAEVIAEVGTRYMPQIESLFRALVSGTSIATAVRHPSRVGELTVLMGGSRQALVSIVQAFRAPGCNFLRTSQNLLDRDEVIVDISHESLIRQWSALREWLSKEWRDRAAWIRLVSAEEHYRLGEGGLLTGLDLQNLSAWWEMAHPTPTWAKRHGGHYDLVSTFLETSQKAETAREQTALLDAKRERTRLRLYIAGLATAFIVAAGMAVDAHYEAREARTATGNSMAAERRAKSSEKEKENQAAIASAKALESEKNAQLAIANLAIANKNAEEAHTNLQQANETAQKSAAFLEDVSNELYKDQSSDLVGTRGLRSQLMGRLMPYQAELSSRNAQAFAPEARISNEYRQALSFQSAGNASHAMDQYRQAFEDGLKTINTHAEGPNTDDRLMATFLTDAFYYAWYLLDIGETKRGGAVVEKARDVLKHHHFSRQTTELLIAQGRFENLEGRYASDREARKLHDRKAVDFAERAVAAQDSSLAAKALAVTVLGNLASMTEEPESTKLVERLCGLAGKMEQEGPMNARSIDARVSCLVNQAEEAYQRGDSKLALEKIEQGSERLQAALAVDPGDTGLLLVDAKIENLLADYGNDDAFKNRHRMNAQERLVKALTGRILLQSNTTQLRTIFDRASLATFPNDQDELRFYKQVFDAMTPTLNAFPKSPSFAYIAGTSSSKIGEKLHKDKATWKEGEAYLARSLDWFEKSGITRDLSQYSEDFSTYCLALEQGAAFYADLGRSADMEATFQKMRSSCMPALEKYPWDVYLRVKLINADAVEGKTFLEQQRYADARVYLERASHWGDKDSSNLLASMYRKGEGVPADPGKADGLETLAKKQTIARMTIPVRFGPSEQPVDFYLHQWPPEFVAQYPGISDQVKWLRDVRNAKIDQEQVDAFSKLQTIALSNDDSYPNLVFTGEQITRYSQLVAAKRQADADRLLQELVDAARQLIIAVPGTDSKNNASIIFRLEAVLLHPEDKVSSRRAFVESVEMAEKLPENRPAYLDRRVESYDGLGVLDFQEKKTETAEKEFAKAFDAARKSVELEPTVDAEESLLTTASHLVKCLNILKREAETAKILADLVATVQPLVDRVHTDEARLEGIRILLEVAGTGTAAYQFPGAVEYLIRARDLTKSVDVNTLEGAFSKYSTFNGLGDAFLQADKVSDARDAYLQAALSGDRYIQFRLASPPQVANKDTTKIYEMYGSISYLYVEAGRFDQAIRAAQSALALQPDAFWIEANMAHGLLLSGKPDGAIKHYMHARKGVIGGRSVTQATKDDFEQLRKLGFNSPLMPGILAKMEQP